MNVTQFKKFEILEYYLIKKDDTGNQFSLCKLKTFQKDDNFELELEPRVFWKVLGLSKQKWGNGQESFCDMFFYKDKKVDLYSGEINGIKIEEIEVGRNSLFVSNPLGWKEEDSGLTTKFKITHGTL